MQERSTAKAAERTAGAARPRRIIAKIVPRSEGGRGFLAGMRIRKKLFVLHTFFSIALTFVLLVALRPAIGQILERSEMRASVDVLAALTPMLDSPDPRRVAAARDYARARPNIILVEGQAAELDIPREAALAASLNPGVVLEMSRSTWEPSAIVFLTSSEGSGRYAVLSVFSPEAREGVLWLYLYALVALLLVYGMVALALEIFVLPQSVYDPIRRVLAADRAVQQGRSDEELVPEIYIPQDELGEIMRSRNSSIRALRDNQRALRAAMAQIEESATDLRRKNHLLETARRNLADADRLASLGVMSAGIAHELNTPLAVIKGSVEQIAADPSRPVDPSRAALMLRVVERLERLSESLLDFARVRPPRSSPTPIRQVVDEAATLLRLDRTIVPAGIENRVDPAIVLSCDADRMTQVFLNLLRNASEAMSARRDRAERDDDGIVVESECLERDGARWIAVRVIDSGPGIAPSILPRLFEPFASTRLDSRGTGLGLAVAEGIVREHGGVLLARNRSTPIEGTAPGVGGAIFEVLLPMEASGDEPASSDGPTSLPAPLGQGTP